MNKNETINSIKESLKKLFATDMKCSDFVLTDGKKITSTATDLEIGVEVYAVDELGNQTPLDNGDYVLQDGRTITVVDNGITTIAGEMSTEAESPVSNADVEQEMTDGMVEPASEEGDMGQRVADLEAQLEEVLNLLKQMSEAQMKSQDQMMSKIKTIANEPGDEKVKVSKVGYNEYSSKNVNAKRNMSEIEELRSLISNKNKRDNNLAL
jgi:hypothetical protein